MKTKFPDLINDADNLSEEELKEIKQYADMKLTERRLNEIEKALLQARREAAEGKLKYYSSGEDFVSSLNEE
ncbi:MAG: hypothetical protein ABJA79_08660 [Parafilimonas sp.]